MSRYYFNVRCDALEMRDMEGAQCRDMTEARAGALVVAGELIRLHLWGGGLARSGWIEVEDQDHSTILRLPLRSAAS